MSEVAPFKKTSRGEQKLRREAFSPAVAMDCLLSHIARHMCCTC